MKSDRRAWVKLTTTLAWDRAHCKCELCLEEPDWRGLSGAHIIRRSKGKLSQDNASNVLIACAICHDHYRYPTTGLPVSVEEGLALAAKLNARYSIDPLFEGK